MCEDFSGDNINSDVSGDFGLDISSDGSEISNTEDIDVSDISVSDIDLLLEDINLFEGIEPINDIEPFDVNKEVDFNMDISENHASDFENNDDLFETVDIVTFSEESDELAVESNSSSGDEITDDSVVDSKPSSFNNDIHNPNLFTDNPKGKYEYFESDVGKSAKGHLDFTDEAKRNPKAQLAAGGKDRLDKDDGGHLIGARYGGASGAENLDAQNRNVNRKGFKSIENGWAKELKDGNNVYVNVENYNSNNSERPDATMGYSITEDANGNRAWDAFSFQNTSYIEQEEWGNMTDGLEDNNAILNPMQDAKNFDQEAYNEAMNEEKLRK